jgi:hypothetical protein
MEVISIERSTYEELHPRLTPAPYQGTSNVLQMKAMAGRGTDKRLGEWLDRSNLFACLSKNQDVCQILNIGPRTLQTHSSPIFLRPYGSKRLLSSPSGLYFRPNCVRSA